MFLKSNGKIIICSLVSMVLMSCVQAKDNKTYFCYSNAKSSILLVSDNYPDITNLKYYPYFKDINISKPIKVDEIDMGENAKPEVYRTSNEIIDDKVTGQYTFMSQGYLLYGVSYLNFKTNKLTTFDTIISKLENIHCL